MSWNSHCAGCYSKPPHSYPTVNHNFILEQGLAFWLGLEDHDTMLKWHLLNTLFSPAHKEQVINAAVWLDNDDVTVEAQLMNVLWLMMRQAKYKHGFFSFVSFPLKFWTKENVPSHSRKLRQQTLSLFHLNNISYQQLYNRHCLTLKATLINNNDDNNVLLWFLLLQMNRTQREYLVQGHFPIPVAFTFGLLCAVPQGLPWCLSGRILP